MLGVKSVTAIAIDALSNYDNEMRIADGFWWNMSRAGVCACVSVLNHPRKKWNKLTLV